MALGIGGAISFAGMMMAWKVGELISMRLHITELLLLMGVAVLMVVEPPLRREAVQPQVWSDRDPGEQPSVQKASAA